MENLGTKEVFVQNLLFFSNKFSVALFFINTVAFSILYVFTDSHESSLHTIALYIYNPCHFTRKRICHNQEIQTPSSGFSWVLYFILIVSGNFFLVTIFLMI